VKCPKCGFVSHPGLSKCKKCGRSFVPAAGKESSSLISTLFSIASSPAGARPHAAAPPPPTAAPSHAASSAAMPERPPVAAVEPAHPPVPEPGHASAQAPPAIAHVDFVPPAHARDAAALWRQELSGKVQDFRQRRSRLRRGSEPSTTLDFDFETAMERKADEIDLDAESPASEMTEPERTFGPLHEDQDAQHDTLDSVPLEKGVSGMRILSGAAVQAGELALGHPDASSESVEIILDSGRASRHEMEPEASTPVEPRALIGRRFTAGLVDAGVLLAGLAMFVGIFWYVAARGVGVAPRPVNLIALGVLAALLVLFYFGMSVALTGSTPGLAWMGLEIRNLDGNLPGTRESMWRAFGYLVSTSALFLGFVWAIFDSDGLTWHDLISGTYITTRD